MMHAPRAIRVLLCRRGRAGAAFTLLELLVVVFVVALLMSILLPGLRRAKEQARSAACASNARQLTLANAAYASENAGRYCPGAARFVAEELGEGLRFVVTQSGWMNRGLRGGKATVVSLLAKLDAAKGADNESG